jgi:RNA polymerase II subunit A small phosphatase-like protein
MMLGKVHAEDEGKKTLVLDLDGTLIHTSFEPVAGATFEQRIDMGGEEYIARVFCRPNLERFLEEAASRYELVVFTAASQEYADPIIDRIDTNKKIRHRRYRQHCSTHAGLNFVKDLSGLGRPIESCLIVDNSPLSYLLHWHNAIDCSTFVCDKEDDELSVILHFLTLIHHVKDVRNYCIIWRHPSIVSSAVIDEMLSTRPQDTQTHLKS